MPARKKFLLGQEHGFIGDRPSKRAKPKEIDNSWFEAYRVKRDDVLLADMFVSEDTKELIIERRKVK